MDSFGLAPIKKEGMPDHPDGYHGPGATDEWYKRQFEAYISACREMGLPEDLIESYRRSAVRDDLVNK